MAGRLLVTIRVRADNLCLLFLASQGVTTRQLQQIVSKQATVLNLNVEDNLKPKAAYLTDTMVSATLFCLNLCWYDAYASAEFAQ
jgi:hypothetical protein